MIKLFSILAFVLINVGIIFGQVSVDIPITVFDNAGGSKVLNVGIDLTATTGIDPLLDEADLPPFPPAGVFEARWNLQPFGVGTLSTYKDYRNAPSFPYSGTVTHRLIWQYKDLATQMSFTYNLPPQATLLITSNNTTPIWTTGTLTGSGTYVLPDTLNEYTAARVYVTYNNATDVEVDNQSPEYFNLSQNYPNPFNPSTKIQYSISSNQVVQLKIYDVLGKELITLVNNEQPAGTYEVNFDGNNLTSGIYFYTITAGNYTDTKSMILMK